MSGLDLDSIASQIKDKPELSIRKLNRLKDANRLTRSEMARWHHLIGRASYFAGDFQFSIAHLDTAIANYSALNDSAQLSMVYNDLGNTFFRKADYPASLNAFYKALQIADNKGLTESAAVSYNGIGLVYDLQKDYDLALVNLKHARYLNHMSGQHAQEANNYHNIGSVFLKTGVSDSALFYYKCALQIDMETGNNSGYAASLNNIGVIYKRMEQFDSALYYYRKALILGNDSENPFLSAASYNNISTVYRLQGDAVRSLSYIDSSLQIAKSFRFLTIQRDAYLNQMYAFEALEDYENALLSLKYYIAVNDSVTNENVKKQLEELHANYQLKEQEDEIELLVQQKMLQDSEIKRQKQQKFLISAILIVIFLLVLIAYNRHRLKQRLLLEQMRTLAELKSLRLQMNPHFIFNALGSISSYISENKSDDAIRFVSKFGKLIRYILEKSAESEVPLREELQFLELYLELEKMRFDQKFDYMVDIAPAVDQDQMIPPLIIQTFAENAIRHGFKKIDYRGMLNIDVVMEEGALICIIEDNGIGRKKSQEMKSPEESNRISTGIENSRERLQYFHGNKNGKYLEIDDLIDKGSVVGTRVKLNFSKQI